MWAGKPLRGVVHDPTTRFMGGVAGHAGLFTTAADLARFATFLLNLGELDGSRIVSPLTVKKFTQPNTPPSQPTLRGLGWDIDSPFSGNRGELFPIGSYGHTGFTGTSLRIDPASRTFVILLANSVHPTLRPAMTSLRARVATIAAASLGIDSQDVHVTGFNELQPARAIGRNAEVLTGIDVLAARKIRAPSGQTSGPYHQSRRFAHSGQRNIDAMLAAGVKLTALFRNTASPAKRTTKTSPIPKTPIPALPSLASRGADRKPSGAALAQIDVLVFDIQDIGARFYTYVSTMKNAMQAAADAHIPFYVLDRPDPIPGRPRRRPHDRSGRNLLRGLHEYPPSPRHDTRRTRPHDQYRGPHKRQPRGGTHEELAPLRLVRFHRPHLGGPRPPI